MSCFSSGTNSPMDAHGSTCLIIIQLRAPTSARVGLAAERSRQAADAEDFLGHVGVGGHDGRRGARRRSAFARPRAADGPRRRMHRRFRRHQARVRRDEHVDDRRVVHGAAAFEEDRDRGLVRHARSIRAVRGQRIEAVHDRQDACADGYVRSPEPVGISRAVPVLVVVPHDRDDRIREVDRREDLGADRRVQLHLLELGGRQLARLVEDVLGHRDLAGVVQQPARLDRLQRLLVGDPQLARQADGCALHSTDVAVRDFVFRIDRRRQRFDGRQVQAVELLDVALRVLEAAERRLQRQVGDEEDRRNERDGD